MSETTVKQLATLVGIPAEQLLSQMVGAGIDKSSPDDVVTDDEKQRLLAHIRSGQTKVSAEPAKVTLRRKSTSTIKAGAGAVTVEVRKKRTYVHRESTAEAEKQRETEAAKLREEQEVQERARLEAVEGDAGRLERRAEGDVRLVAPLPLHERAHLPRRRQQRRLANHEGQPRLAGVGVLGNESRLLQRAVEVGRVHLRAEAVAPAAQPAHADAGLAVCPERLERAALGAVLEANRAEGLVKDADVDGRVARAEGRGGRGGAERAVGRAGVAGAVGHLLRVLTHRAELEAVGVSIDGDCHLEVVHIVEDERLPVVPVGDPGPAQHLEGFDRT